MEKGYYCILRDLSKLSNLACVVMEIHESSDALSGHILSLKRC